MGKLIGEQSFEFLLSSHQERPSSTSYTIIDADYNPYLRKVDAESIKNEFDTS